MPITDKLHQFFEDVIIWPVRSIKAIIDGMSDKSVLVRKKTIRHGNSFITFELRQHNDGSQFGKMIISDSDSEHSCLLTETKIQLVKDAIGYVWPDPGVRNK